jgi:hypothetical protein
VTELAARLAKHEDPETPETPETPAADAEAQAAAEALRVAEATAAAAAAATEAADAKRAADAIAAASDPLSASFFELDESTDDIQLSDLREILAETLPGVVRQLAREMTTDAINRHRGRVD